MHRLWLISMWQEHAFLAIALHFIQIPLFTYVFPIIRRVTIANVGITDGSPIVCWNPTEINCAKYVVCFGANWNNAWTLVNFFGTTRTCIFSYCVTFYPNTSVHLRLSHHSQGDHVGSVCRMHLRPSLIVVSPENLRLFKGFLVGFGCKYAKHDFMI